MENKSNFVSIISLLLSLTSVILVMVFVVIPQCRNKEIPCVGCALIDTVLKKRIVDSVEQFTSNTDGLLQRLKNQTAKEESKNQAECFVGLLNNWIADMKDEKDIFMQIKATDEDVKRIRGQLTLYRRKVDSLQVEINKVFPKVSTSDVSVIVPTKRTMKSVDEIISYINFLDSKTSKLSASKREEFQQYLKSWKSDITDEKDIAQATGDSKRLKEQVDLYAKKVAELENQMKQLGISF